MQSKILTISIVTYNGGEDLKRCLHSLSKQTFSDFELNIYDNASKDNSVEIVGKFFPRATIYKNCGNSGFDIGHNYNINHSCTPWILVLNQDVILKPDCLENILKATNDHSVASISPCLLFPSGNEKIIDSVGLSKKSLFKVIDRGSGQKLTDDFRKSCYVWGVSGGFALYRRKAIEQVAYDNNGSKEYFDENFFMYKEDIDLAARLNKAGWKSWYQADAIAIHDRTTKTIPKKLSETKNHRSNKPEYVNRLSYQNHWLFLIKNLPLILFGPVFLYEGGKFLYLLINERKTLKAIPKVLKKLPVMIKRRYV